MFWVKCHCPAQCLHRPITSTAWGHREGGEWVSQLQQLQHALCCVDRPPLTDNRTICRPSCHPLLGWVSVSHCSTVRWLTNSQRMTLPVPTQQLAGASQRWTQAVLQMHCTRSPFPVSLASVTCCWLHVSTQRGNVGERASVIWHLTAESPAAGDRPTDQPSTLTVVGTVAY